jgi:uncharacterized protein (TIGR03437 family)
MNRKRNIFIGKTIAICAAIPVLLFAYAEGPDPGKTGAPGDSTCLECHTGTALNGGGGRVTISFAGGNTYTPGQTQRVTVRIEDPQARRWGFQATARLKSNERAAQAGSFSSTDANTQIICASGSRPPCSAAAQLQFIEHTSAGTRPGTTVLTTFEFDWVAPATNSGDVVFYVAANAANGNGTNDSGDHIYTTSATLTPAAAGGTKPTVSQNGVSNGASFQAPIAPKAWLQVKGTDFGDGFTNDFRDGKYPTEVNGLSVLVNDKPAPLWFNNGTQINALVPDDTATGPVQVVVVRNGQRSDAATIQMERFAPAFFVWPQNQAVATDVNFAWKVKAGTFAGVNTTPAAPGDIVVLWGTGFGPVSPDVPAGQQTPAAIHSIVTAPTIRIGGVQAEYLGGALAPGFAGLYQIAVRVPGTLQNGDHPVVAEVGGLSSPSNITLTVQR